MKTKKLLAATAVLGTVLAGLVTAAPASADPITEGYAVVGSDTLQDSMNALVNGTRVSGATVRVTAGGQPIGNWDAFPTNSQIRTKSSGGFFLRPAGSGAGRDALRASIKKTGWQPGGAGTATYNVTGQVDIARSSGGPGSNANADGKLLYVPYARDAVSYAYNGDPAAIGSLSFAQLQQIYTSNSKVTINGVTITARLPQSASGTRSFFLAQLGIGSGSGQTALGSSVVGATDTTTPENDASVLGAGEIIPFSAASWIAQSNGAAPSTIAANSPVNLGSVDGIAPFTGTAPSLTANPTYYSGQLGRDTYLIVERARVTSGSSNYDAKLAALVNGASQTSLVGWPSDGSDPLPSSPAAVKLAFGFLPPSTATPIPAYING